MPLNKSQGNMYDWSATWNPLAGKCPHNCSYCYVPSVVGGKEALKEKYSGKARLYEKELKTKLTGVGKDQVIFVCNMIDMFAEDVTNNAVMNILDHCKKYSENTYLFQSKNPGRMLEFIGHFPTNVIFGTTIESNRNYFLSDAPGVWERIHKMKDLKDSSKRPVMVSIEPILDFDVDVFSSWFIYLDPDFVSIGADSKKNRLPEPASYKLNEFVSILKANNIEIREKKNLGRLM